MSKQAITPAGPTPAFDIPRGMALLRDPVLNKGTAFTEEERDALGLRGLLPPGVSTMAEQEMRVMGAFYRKHNDLERYIHLVSLQARNETLFYRVLIDRIEELMPIVYTPTVGEACQKYGHIYRRPRGLFVTAEDRCRVVDLLRNWPEQDIRVIVVTDGERILGLGDLGASGMGIPVGKLALYTACAGIRPSQCLPVTLDVGTDNQELREDPLYIGLNHGRIRGPLYDELLDELVEAVQAVYPKALLQFEDFANHNAFLLLHRYRDRACTFNDDIQGTGAVALAGLLAGSRLTGHGLADQCFLFQGAGEAGMGIAGMIVAALRAGGMSEAEARRHCWFVDSQGLVVASRADLNEHKRAYAHEHPPLPDLPSAVRALRPSAIIGVSGRPGAFTQAVLEAMAKQAERPIVMALSNPTSRAECTAEQAYAWTGGRAIFASGSPFDPVRHGDRTLVPGQGNNAYIFPGVGLGVVVSEARRVTPEMFHAAAEALAAQVTDEDFAQGRIYPPLARIREVSVAIGLAVAEVAYARELARRPRPPDLEATLREEMYQPVYPSYV